MRRDFEVKAPTGSEIAARAESGGYANRYELLRDLGLVFMAVPPGSRREPIADRASRSSELGGELPQPRAPGRGTGEVNVTPPYPTQGETAPVIRRSLMHGSGRPSGASPAGDGARPSAANRRAVTLVSGPRCLPEDSTVPERSRRLLGELAG